MALLRASGLPIPSEVYGYSPAPDNAADRDRVYLYGVRKRHSLERRVVIGLGEEDIISISRQLAQLEARMMSIPFPAGGNLYYTKDLETVAAGRWGIPLDDERFCVGLDTRLPLDLWYGRRSQTEDPVGRSPPFFFVNYSPLN
jgi:hypothetical protein